MVLSAAAASVIVAGLSSKGGPLDTSIRAPRGPAAEDLQAFLDSGIALRRRGLTPVQSVDPFTGNLVLSTEDQTPLLFDILGERFARQQLATTAEESRAIFEAREAFIESRRVNPVFPITPAAIPTVSDPVVDQVRETVIASLVRTSPQVVAPGVVSSTTAQPRRRLGGPCAGLTTGIQRIGCARGGFA